MKVLKQPFCPMAVDSVRVITKGADGNVVAVEGSSEEMKEIIPIVKKLVADLEAPKPADGTTPEVSEEGASEEGSNQAQ